jgi:hypothetical protein
MAAERGIWDSLFTNCRLATMAPGGAAYGAIEEAAIAVQDGRIAWVGTMRDATNEAQQARPPDLRGRWLARLIGATPTWSMAAIALTSSAAAGWRL